MNSNDVVNNVEVFGIERSFKEAKYPMSVMAEQCTGEYTETIGRLAKSPKGSAHDNFLKGILVRFDLTFTVKAWIEAERYHWLEIVSSQSTMHRISRMDYDECMIEYVTENTVNEIKRLSAEYNENPTSDNYLKLLYNCPVGIRLTAGMSTNYQQLKTIYAQRKNHKLPEWRTFCEWIRTLPYSELIIGERNADECENRMYEH